MTDGRKTYAHLAGTRRLPSAYEIGTTRLLYYVERGGFAVDLPTSDWYRRYQVASPLQCAPPAPAAPPAARHNPWEEFADPRATTYASYVALQRERESFVAQLLDEARVAEHDSALPAAWIDVLDVALAPLRFVAHGLQMVSAYVGQMAPSGRITVAALFQTADQVRRVHGVARRTCQLAGVRAGFCDRDRALWEGEPAWQPLRRTIEELLCTYDWGEALVALNVCVAPAVDELCLLGLARLAERHGDYVDAQLLRSFVDDGRWHRAWTQRLLELACRAAGSRDAVGRWVARWRPAASDAIVAAAPLLGPDGPAIAAQAVRATGELIDAIVTPSTGNHKPEGRDVS